MYNWEYFNLIQREIFYRKIYYPTVEQEIPPVVIAPEINQEPEFKIPLPLEQINKDYNIKKYKKRKNKRDKKKKIENKKQIINPFFQEKNNNIINPFFISNNINIISNKKIDLLKDMNKFGQNQDIFINNKKGNFENINIVNSENSYFSKSLDTEEIMSHINNLNLEENIRRVNSMKDLVNKINIQTKNF